MADATLLPCPFCGKPPLIVCPDNSYGSAMITCGDANECPVDPTAWGDLATGETIEDAKRAWNTRQPQLPSDDGLIKALRETIVELWHDANSGHGTLHECLGMTWEEYQLWVMDPEALSRHKAPLSVAEDDGSLTLDNASVQRLMDYGLLHRMDDGWHVGPWPETNDALTARQPAPAAGDDVERLIDELREHGTDLTVEYARAVPKRLLIEAANRLTALQVTAQSKQEGEG